MEAPIKFTVADSRIPIYYIISENDVAVPAKIQRQVVANIPNCVIFSMEAGHSAFITHPDQVAGLLERCGGNVKGVSWNWGGGAPGGTVAEKKTEGQVAIKSKRGNTIKKNAEPDNPAVHIERSGNDVVKKASELTVESKGSQGKEGDEHGEKRKAKSQDVEDDAKESDGEEESEEDPHTKTKTGKEVKKGGKAANKKQKKKQEEDDELDKDTDDGEEDDEIDSDNNANETQKSNQQTPKEVAKDLGEDRKQAQKNGAKKDSKTKTPQSASKINGKAKRQPAPRQEGDMPSTRTRSQGNK
ncbi:hypothetical protein JX265_007937 [Neoarthrinium moseri]|uniref:Hypervirulence associated protein TUDOR domain-containing protein n=1 Tax=Neoarthrinium moseri TaxID=1658444 RepID=A0A9P9WIU8_9PEZI|nr:hypothetical protein JX266_004547 [Neoarthrinium moseri]KAI1865614.1 hypothetical protein JX265_007937 [Neoarthrinium moseri]